MRSAIPARASLRYLARHPWQPLLATLGVGLGVAVVIAVNLATASADRAFRLSMETLTGPATHQVVGGPLGVPEDVYARMRIELGETRARPLVEATVQTQGEGLRLLGIDPLAEADLTTSTTRSVDGAVAIELLTSPASALLAETTARRFGIEPGGRLSVAIADQTHEIEIIGLIPAADEREAVALSGLLLTDISTAQELLERENRLDRIDLALTDDPGAVERIGAWLSPDLQLLRSESRNAATAQMTEAFQTNLKAMALLALVVGIFLIYNSVSFAVLQRRDLFATLRVLGMTRGAVFLVVILESMVIGLLGGLAGAVAGLLLAEILLELVSRTINDLYFTLQVNAVSVDIRSVAGGVAAGTGCAVIAALVPAWEAARTRPRLAQSRSNLEVGAHHLAPWLAGIGLALLAAALTILATGASSLAHGFASLFLVILGYSLISPLGVVALSRAWSLLLSRGLLGRLANRGIDAALSRTGVAITALAVAVSASVGVGIMVDSFRLAVERWLDQTLQADIYLSADTQGGPGRFTMGDVSALEALPGVQGVSTGRPVRLETSSGPITLFALSLGPTGHRGLDFKQGDPDIALRGFEAGEGVIVTEPFASHTGLVTGTPVDLPTQYGMRSFPVLGVVYDYGSDRGMVLVDRELYRQHWNDPTLSSIGLYLSADQRPSVIVERARQELADRGPVDIRSTGEIRRLSLEVFDRTFTITRVLRLLVIAVAFVAILGALMALQLERTREYAILRATGFTPAQIWGVVGLQTFLMGLYAALLALPLGLMTSWILVSVINLRAFGWSMELVIPWGIAGDALMLALVPALLAAIYPAWRLAGTSPAQALRED